MFTAGRFLVLGLGLAAQLSLEPRPGPERSWQFGFFLYVLAALAIVLTRSRHRWMLPPWDEGMPGGSQELGWTCLCARRYDEAITAFGQVLSKNPKNTYTRRWLADTYALKGMREKFFAECDSLKALGSDGSYYSYAICGVREKALARVEELRDAAEREYVEPVYLATYYAVLGDKDKAFSWLRRGFETRSVGMVRIMKADPYFDGLHSDPRWSELLRLMKFPEGNL